MQSRQGTDPMLERPDEHEEVGTELYCWMPGNYDRECNGSCVAYQPADEIDEPSAACKVLSVLRMMGAASQVAARHIQNKSKSRNSSQVAEAIQNLPDPPEVR